LLFIAESGKYHPVVVLLHNHKWLKKISKKVSLNSSSFDTVQCILSSVTNFQAPHLLQIPTTEPGNLKAK
jgi:hypothetical protein